MVPAAAYGMRVYRAGQTMRRHCDRLETHAIGSTILVDSELDEPWPLTIEDHDGKPHEVALEPGQMVMYESAKCPHSRPRPMNGRHYCTLFLHYKPATGWDYTLDRLVEPTTTAQR